MMADNQRTGPGAVNGATDWRNRQGEGVVPPGPVGGEPGPATRSEVAAAQAPAVIPTSYAARSLLPADPLPDQVRWGPVFAGLLSAMIALLMLSLLGAAIGLTVLDGNIGTATSSGTATWGAIAAIIAFLIGGFVAGRMAASVGRAAGAFNGALVFMLAVPVVLWLAGQGVGALVGSLGAGSLGFGAFAGGNGGFSSGFGRGAVRLAANGVRVTAWGALIGIAVGLVAGAVGGALGSHRRSDVPLRHAE